MNAAATHRSLELSHKLYQYLLAAYPRSHREEYGGAMAQLFRDQCRDAWAEGRAWGLLTLWLRILPDLLKTSFLERCASLHPGKFMTAKLNTFFPPGRTPLATFCGVFIVVFLLVFTTAAIVTFILPETYASTARIKVEADDSNSGYTTGGPADHIGVYDPFFVQTTFEIIQSQLVLSNVVSTLDLNAKWGKKYNGGEPLATTETMEILKRRLVLQPVRNTKLISITVYDEDRQEAADLANAVVKAYQDYRINSRRELLRGGLIVLQQQLTETESKIQTAQTNLASLRAQFNLTDSEPNSADEQEQVHTRPYWEAKRELAALVEFNKQLAAKIELTKLDLQIPPQSLVEITDVAQPGNAPVKPNKPLNLVLGAIAGIILGSVAGLIVATLVHRRVRRLPKPAIQS